MLKGVLYAGSDKSVMRENAINCPIFLENSHQFENDPEWGEIMGRMRMGNNTLEDRQEINKHFQKPSERNNIPTEATAVCVSKKERNTIEFRAWKTYITENHPSIHSNELPPDNVWFIECLQLDWTSKTSRRKINFPTNQKGYDTFESTVGKLSTSIIQLFEVCFCRIYF